MIDQNCLDTLFLSARTQNGWLDQPVSDEQLRSIYDIACSHGLGDPAKVMQRLPRLSFDEACKII